MIRKRKQILTLILASVISSTLCYKVNAAYPTRKRLAGEDRYITSLKVAQDGWDSSYYAVLACGEDYPDALSSVPLAKKYDAPILLTHRTYIDSSIVEELKSLKVGKVFIIGGTASISDTILNQLNSLDIQTERIGGVDRYDTSVKIAEKFGKVNTLTVATGEDYADAISIGSAAGAMGVPVLLVPKNIMPEGTRNYIEELNTVINSDYNNKQKGQTTNSSNEGEFRNIKVFVVGDNSVVSDNVAREFENTFKDDVTNEQFGYVERITGSDKYERNINVIARFLEKSTGTDVDYDDVDDDDYTKTDYSTKYDLFSLNNIFVASGDGFADALSGAAEAAKNRAPVILSGTSNSNLIKDLILTKIPNYNNDSTNPEYITVLGGEGVLPNSRVREIFGYIIGDKNTSTGDSSITTFQDSKLEKLIRDKVGKPIGTLAYSDLKNITSLNLSNEGITDISGLESCVNLKSLDLSYNQIKDVKPLLKLYDIKDLNLSHNKISDVSYLSNLTSLEQLNLSDNNISDLSHSRENTKDDDDSDYDKTSDSVFKNMTHLAFLDLSNSSVSGSYSYKNSIDSSDLDELEYLIRLTSLNLKGTNVASLTNLKELETLTTLNLSDTSVSNLEPLEELTDLTYLDLSNNSRIDGDDLKPLQYLTKLKYLNLSNNRIDDLTYLKGLKNLNTLYLEDNPILDYTPILSYKNSLYYRDFDISSISGDVTYSKDSTIDGSIKGQINDFEDVYEYGDYDKLRFRVLYRPYDTGAYSDTLKGLKQEMDWLQQEIASGGMSSLELKNVNDDLTSVKNELSDITKKDAMNSEAANLENQLSSSYDAKDMEKIINKINYEYSDYRYDYYRTLVDRCTSDIQNIKAQIQLIGLQGSGYSSTNTIDSLQNMLEEKQKNKDFAEEKINMYDRYRNFFNAVNSVLEQN
ncbi:cell wall-binding repeat-containing protein [Clostridium kluyveri]|uniref:Predicted surface-layer protein n=2 Tax=Clostridium kluyveri TaxID=1534 RepID=A5N761_CLOK5|nr:cell wall-binding repeat-containing protein [Clostridium kluyveri]EDK33142.1 Predicted surface-layer protein [Clostridium kluyveri DSM 555]BAH06052.1 hypothetical protein CKR_1001 [Clostridium kluyveri NBRC 12016]